MKKIKNKIRNIYIMVIFVISGMIRYFKIVEIIDVIW